MPLLAHPYLFPHHSVLRSLSITPWSSPRSKCNPEPGQVAAGGRGIAPLFHGLMQASLARFGGGPGSGPGSRQGRVLTVPFHSTRVTHISQPSSTAASAPSVALLLLLAILLRVSRSLPPLPSPVIGVGCRRCSSHCTSGIVFVHNSICAICIACYTYPAPAPSPDRNPNRYASIVVGYH